MAAEKRSRRRHRGLPRTNKSPHRFSRVRVALYGVTFPLRLQSNTHRHEAALARLAIGIRSSKLAASSIGAMKIIRIAHISRLDGTQTSLFLSPKFLVFVRRSTSIITRHQILTNSATIFSYRLRKIDKVI